ncbi:hypothetical protein DPMN_096857 [Dreissena polymorpha]|uniref:Uncharacterized protein n=1 Tax=Dreissena polymorpha TaxID=45954 RepID=A0A9D4LA63_DREPO|nr:hypothetical protein DPMN_096857 [Dreissena polymorpha]
MREAIDCGEEAARWVSDFLGEEGLRVVCQTHDLKKTTLKCAKKPWPTKAVDTDSVCRVVDHLLNATLCSAKPLYMCISLL